MLLPAPSGMLGEAGTSALSMRGPFDQTRGDIDMKRQMTAIAMACSLACGYAFMNVAKAADAAATPQTSQDERADARSLVSEAALTLSTMKSDPQVLTLLREARGVFVVPNYGRGAFLVGGQGGEGVMVARQNGTWSDPVFYNIGGISLGAQFGAEGGRIAMLLMTDRAVDRFKQQNNFSLNADAGLTIIDYSARALGSAGMGDVVLWSDTAGAYAGLSLGVTDVSYDDNANRAYYRAGNVSAQRILNGDVINPRPLSAQLKAALPSS
jgi:SH3 domain-containing YSC84-like protein 1